MSLADWIHSDLGAHQWLFDGEGSDLDSGLLYVSDRERLSPSMNVSGAINQFAINSPVVGLSIEDAGGALVDSYYGRLYTGVPVSGSAIYGTTDDLPYQPFDEQANRFLRAPFKRIPCVPVRSLTEIERVVDVLKQLYGADRLLYRGQNQEYLLRRSEEARVLLYGDSQASEPSLLASASRRAPSIEACMSEWMMWVQLCQHANLNRLHDHYSGMERRALEHFYEQVSSQWTNEHFYYFSLALAQHYGLPSAGLDLTDELPTALFFALQRLETSEPGRLRARPVAPDAKPVLYILLREGSREFPFHETAHEIFRSGRPACQGAWFLHVGWGLNRNAASNQILIALDLDPRGDYGAVAQAADLFPGPDQDPLARFLGSVDTAASETLRRVLQDFYWVDPAELEEI